MVGVNKPLTLVAPPSDKDRRIKEFEDMKKELGQLRDRQDLIGEWLNEVWDDMRFMKRLLTNQLDASSPDSSPASAQEKPPAPLLGDFHKLTPSQLKYLEIGLPTKQ